MIRRSLAIVASLLAAGACGDDVSSEAPDGAPPDTSEPPFTPPYALPAPGTVVDIPTTGRNTANDVRPPGHDEGSWQYALFQSYGGGVFQPASSQAGAYVFAGQGGHDAPPVFGAALFDFTDGTWAYVPNGNGFDENRSTDVAGSETNGLPYVELIATSMPEMPAPGHTYSLMIAPPSTAPRGTVIRVFGTAMAGPNVWDSYQSHQLDLATGVWSRAAQNLASAAFTTSALTDQTSALDPVTGRIYAAADWPNSERLAYLDLADRTWKTVGNFTNAPGGDRYARSMWVDAERRLLLILAVSYEQGTVSLWAFDLDDPSAGPHQLTVTGDLPGNGGRWQLYPTSDGGDGAFYTVRGRPSTPYDAPPYPLASDQVLDRLAPPASDPLTNPWTFSTVPITGGIVGEYVTDFGAGARHMTRFFYVPALRCFAWIPNGSGPVQLMKP